MDFGRLVCGFAGVCGPEFFFFENVGVVGVGGVIGVGVYVVMSGICGGIGGRLWLGEEGVLGSNILVGCEDGRACDGLFVSGEGGKVGRRLFLP